MADDELELIPEDQPQLVSDKAMEGVIQDLLVTEQRTSLLTVMQTYDGRRVLWDILVEAELHSTTFTGDREGDFKEGRRDLGNWILANKIFPCGREFYAVMGDEAEARDVRAQQLREQRGL